MVRALLLASWLFLSGCSSPAKLTSGKIFFADSGAKKILRANLDGSSVEEVVGGLGEPVGIAVHEEAGHIYWTDAATRKIQRANLNGTDVKDLVTFSEGSPAGISLDVIDGKMYWSDSAIQLHRIQRANLNGSAVETFFSAGLQIVQSVYVHRIGGGTGLHRVYWADSFTRKIQSANLQGLDVYEHAKSDIGKPQGVIWDWQSSKVVWTDSFADEVRRAGFYNKYIEPIVKTDLDIPSGVAIDPNERKLYWADAGTQKIQRSDLNGQRIENVITSGLVRPRGIAIVPAKTTTTTTTTSTTTTSTSTSTTSTSTSTTLFTSTLTYTTIEDVPSRLVRGGLLLTVSNLEAFSYSLRVVESLREAIASAILGVRKEDVAIIEVEPKSSKILASYKISLPETSTITIRKSSINLATLKDTFNQDITGKGVSNTWAYAVEVTDLKVIEVATTTTTVFRETTLPPRQDSYRESRPDLRASGASLARLVAPRWSLHMLLLLAFIAILA